MREAHTIAEVRGAVRDARAGGARIAFVPTMGFLHEGHLALVDEARRRGEFVVMSIFVNPLQFGPSDDFSRYPRDAAGDGAKAAARGVDLLFLPSDQEMYIAARAVSVVPERLAARWEGEVRPGHFAGMLTVVAKLFNIVQPDVTIFGQKDIQQATLVRAMVRDLDFPLEVVVAPTVREADGLAMSSRNSYLNVGDRQRALALSRALRAIEDAFARGEHRAAALERTGRAAALAVAGGSDVRLDYLALVDPQTLEPVDDATTGTVVIIAGRVGTTRLIDNIILGSARQ